MSPRGLEQTIDHSGSRVRAFFIDSLIAADLNNSFEAGGPSAVLFFHGVRGTYEVKHVTRAVGPPASARRPPSSCRLPNDPPRPPRRSRAQLVHTNTDV